MPLLSQPRVICSNSMSSRSDVRSIPSTSLATTRGSVAVPFGFAPKTWPIWKKSFP